MGPLRLDQTDLTAGGSRWAFPLPTTTHHDVIGVGEHDTRRPHEGLRGRTAELGELVCRTLRNRRNQPSPRRPRGTPPIQPARPVTAVLFRLCIASAAEQAGKHFGLADLWLFRRGQQGQRLVLRQLSQWANATDRSGCFSSTR